MPTADVFVFPLHLKSFYHYQKDPPTGLLLLKIGSASRIRTYDLRLRSPLLYPAELWRHTPILAHFSNLTAIAADVTINSLKIRRPHEII